MTDLLELVKELAGSARDGEQVEVYAERSRRFSVRAYQGDIEALTSAEAAGIGIRVVTGGRQGFASAGTLDPDAVRAAFEEARDNARFSEPDEWNAVAEPDGVPHPELDLHRDDLRALSNDAKVALALELERATLAGDPRITGVRVATYGDVDAEAAIATSTGIATSSQATSCWLSVSALANDGTESQIGAGMDVGRTPGELDVSVAARDAVRRATELLGARQPRSSRLTVVLDPRVASAFLGIVAGTLTGDRVVKHRSPFADRLGEAVAAPVLTLADDPTDIRSYGAGPHDGEGLATRRTTLIEGGVLTSFLHDTYTARRMGVSSTASAVRGYGSTPSVGVQALVPVPGTLDLEHLIAEVGDGLLVRSVSGLHSGVNAVSGDFSVGAEGLLIRDGQLAEPVREVTIASTLQRMLLDIVAVGGDLEWLPGGDAGVSLAIAEVSLSGA